MKQKYPIALFLLIISIILTNCGSGEKENIIGLYFQEKNAYNEKEIIQSLSQKAFKNGYTLLVKTYKKRPKKSVFRELNLKKVKIIIFEGDNSKKTMRLVKYAHKKRIFVSLINDISTTYEHLLITTDYKKLGYNIANQLYNYSRRKRTTFLILYNKNTSTFYNKNEILNGYNKFFNLRPEYKILTNYYEQTNREYFKKILNHYLYTYTNNFRGVLTDNDTIAVSLANYLRKIGKDGEVKISGLFTTKSGINSIMKTGITVTGDINRYHLFHSAFSNAVSQYSNLITNKSQIKKIEGIYYNQMNIIDHLAKSQKFSIKEIIPSK